MKMMATDCLDKRMVYYVNYSLPNQPRVIATEFCKPANERAYSHYGKPQIKLSLDGSWFTSHTDVTVNNITDHEIANLTVYTTPEEAYAEAGWL